MQRMLQEVQKIARASDMAARRRHREWIKKNSGRCYACRREGHIRRDCPERKLNGKETRVLDSGSEKNEADSDQEIKKEEVGVKKRKKKKKKKKWMSITEIEVSHTNEDCQKQDRGPHEQKSQVQESYSQESLERKRHGQGHSQERQVWERQSHGKVTTGTKEEKDEDKICRRKNLEESHVEVNQTELFLNRWRKKMKGIREGLENSTGERREYWKQMEADKYTELGEKIVEKIREMKDAEEKERKEKKERKKKRKMQAEWIIQQWRKNKSISRKDIVEMENLNGSSCKVKKL